MRGSRSYVERPSRFKRGNSETAHVFKNTFNIWYNSEIEKFALHDAQDCPVRNPAGAILSDSKKVILSAMSMFDQDAAEWARPYLKTAHNPDTGKCPFSNFDLDKFWAAFSVKYKPVNATLDAKIYLENVKQGKEESFASYFGQFKKWSVQTGYDANELRDCLIKGLNNDYALRLLHQIPTPADVDALEAYLKQVDGAINIMCIGKGLKLLSAQTNEHTSLSATKGNSGFRDPNAMEIDASCFNDLFVNTKGKDAIFKQWSKVMANRCKVCGSSSQGHNALGHSDTTCNHCGKKGHWAKVCKQRLISTPPAAKVTTTPTVDTRAPDKLSLSSLSDNSSDATIAALKDQIELQQKQL